MAYVYPYTLAAFLNVIYPKWTAVEWDVERFDELANLGSGHDIAAELAAPKWKGKMIFADLTRDEEKFLTARVRKLHGIANSFMLFDPRAQYPADDPNGTVLGSAVVQVNSIATDRNALSLKGLPAGYVLSVGDKGQISFATDRNYFFELSESGVANGSGVTPTLEVFPHVPASIALDATVNLKKPACKVALQLNGFTPGRSAGRFTSGLSLDVMERV